MSTDSTTPPFGSNTGKASPRFILSDSSGTLPHRQEVPEVTETPARPLARQWPSSPGTLALVVSLVGVAAILLWGLWIRADTNELGFVVWLNSLHSPVLDALGRFAAVIVGPALAVVWGLVFAGIVAWRSRSVAIGLGAGLAVGLSWASSAVIKLLVDRPRPDWNAIGHHVGVMEVDPSFPSGHVTFIASLTVVTCLLLWRTRFRWWAIVLGALATLLIAVSRMYVGAHYLSDVIAAALYGLFGGILAYALVGWLLSLGQLQQRIDRHVPLTRRAGGGAR